MTIPGLQPRTLPFYFKQSHHISAFRSLRYFSVYLFIVLRKLTSTPVVLILIRYKWQGWSNIMISIAYGIYMLVTQVAQQFHQLCSLCC